MTTTRREWLQVSVFGLLAGGSVEVLNAAQKPMPSGTAIEIWKTPTCGCCKLWVDHMRGAGFRPTVHDMDDVIWAVTTRADAARDTVIINNAPTDTLDPASPLVNLGSKMGIDATQKTREEGYTHEIQQLAVVDEKTKALVDKRWQEYFPR